MAAKCLIVYYSRTGTTQMAAEALAAALQADAERLSDGRSRRGVLGWVQAGVESLTGVTAPLAPLWHNPSAYELVIVGTPVWVNRASTPVRAFLRLMRGKATRLAFFTVCGTQGGDRALAQMAALAGVGPVATLELTQSEVALGACREKLDAFVRALPVPAAAAG
ncbi:MAG: hypothetical protein U0Q12_24295 [Vicinamibacterales bacterium]